MKDTPQISAYMSSIRPYRWLHLHERLKKTGLTFEMVIVGPNEPDFTLPPEINFFKSDVKPSQCFHAAGQMTKGETMLQLVDDLEYDDGTIEAMYKAVSEIDNATATAYYFQNDVNQSLHQNISGYPNNPAYLPLLPVCGLFPRKAWEEHKGLDRRFDGIMGELDFYMRLCMNGYKTIFVPGIVKEDTGHQRKENSGGLCNRYWQRDRTIFIQLWTSNGILYPIRNDIVRPYEDKDLLTVNQFYG